MSMLGNISNQLLNYLFKKEIKYSREAQTTENSCFAFDILPFTSLLKIISIQLRNKEKHMNQLWMEQSEGRTWEVESHFP